jgi:hypothetical protein
MIWRRRSIAGSAAGNCSEGLCVWNEGVSYDAATKDQDPLREKRGPDFVSTEGMNFTGGFVVRDDTLLRLLALNKLLLDIVIVR